MNSYLLALFTVVCQTWSVVVFGMCGGEGSATLCMGNRPWLANRDPYPVEKELLVARHFSANIRWMHPNDAKNNNGWERRKLEIAKIFDHYNPDIIGLQEPTHHNENRGQIESNIASVADTQTEDLVKLSNGHYDAVGYNDGGAPVECVSIMHDKDRFEVRDKGVFYLSDAPHDRLTRAWYNLVPRIIVWARFRDKQRSGHEHVVANTHFEGNPRCLPQGGGHEVRENGTLVYIEELARIASNLPVVAMGDFNAFPDDGGEELYKVLRRLGTDIRDTALEKHIGPDGTFQGFYPYDFCAAKPGCDGNRLDHMFVKGGLQVVREGVIADRIDKDGTVLPQGVKNGVWHFDEQDVPLISDHSFLAADIV